MNQLVFNLQTIPDIDTARRLYDLHGLSDEDVAKAILHKRRQQTQSEQLPHYLQRIVAISAVLISGEQFKLWSLGDENSSEQALLQRFYAGIERYTPRILSWGGRAFDLPVIQYRSLLYPLSACGARVSAEQDNELREQPEHWQQRHTDLQEVLSAHRSQARAGLNEIAMLCGFPGNRAMDDARRWRAWLAGDIAALRENGEKNALNCYLIYLNWQRNRGQLEPQHYQAHCGLIREQLKASGHTHLIEFESNWIDL